jgi:UTP--glucose-1-phosphate uridylyltransferase
VGNEPFAVLLADDMIYCDKTPCLDTMIALSNESNNSVVAVEAVPMDKVSQYGVIEPITIGERLYKLNGVVEKPPREEAPSNLSIVGRYILQPRIFELLEGTQRGAGGEIQLTDAIACLLKEQSIYAYEFNGIRYDCGSKLGYIRANLEFSLRHEEMGLDVKEFIKQLSLT